MNELEMISADHQATVVAYYTPDPDQNHAYQSEAQLEQAFIDQLQRQGYEFVSISKADALLTNLRIQLQNLNNYTFSDNEWQTFSKNVLLNKTEGIVEKSRKIQLNYIHDLKLDNGITKNIKLIDKSHIHNNHLQVINQYQATEGSHHNRYDVTILVNGLPLVHIELKRRGVAIREAFNQINRYQRDSFWAAHGLFEYVQLFVISNGTNTKYYSNTTRDRHLKEAKNRPARATKSSNSFEFTSFWADATNKTIKNLTDFTKTFFAKHTLLNILTKYSIFTSEEALLVMRPYQIVAAERIIQRIMMAHNHHMLSSINSGGYIWHTTGSGKTLTSFKTAQLAQSLPFVDKVLFIVDRKDLDYQTMKEYDRFQKGAASANTSTAELQTNLEDGSAKIIITTIQKLAIFINKNKQHPVYQQHVVLIFDECHRSQFGDMHQAITKNFKRYNLFGFTGTPIFAVNASTSGNPLARTTEQAFGLKLHTYTILDAIHDGNVLPFRIDYANTMQLSNLIKDEQVHAIDTEQALRSPKRITEVVKYILKNFNNKTMRSPSYPHQKELVNAFNSIFATASIAMAGQYYLEFKKQLAQIQSKLKIAMIYSFTPNEEEADELFDNDQLDYSSRTMLEMAITDYNLMFNTNFTITGSSFENYYKDLSLRMKSGEVDLLIVVNMFLTGFDATTLNTLWVDKNLQYHGLLQAFSRTNRILNRVKTFGNIICFRDLQSATNDALALFGNREASGMVLLKSYHDYYHGYHQDNQYYPGYQEIVVQLLADYPLNQEIIGEENKKTFISLFGTLLRLRNILRVFDEFKDQSLLSERQLQDYQSLYIDLYQEFRPKNNIDKTNINDDITFEIELMKQVEVNIDYILILLAKYCDNNCEDKEILISITKAVNASIQLRSKRDLILNFIDQMNASMPIDTQWVEYIQIQRSKEQQALIHEEKLQAQATEEFLAKSFLNRELRTTGSDIDDLLPTMSRFNNSGREEKKSLVTEKLMYFFERFLGLAQ